jgi:hypothetical protein
MSGSDPAVEAGVAAGQQAAALGRNQIQAASAVGQGYDAGQPGFYAPPDIPWVPGTGTAGVVNRAYIVRFIAPSSRRITKIAFQIIVAATTDDPCDVGIFSGDLQTMLGSSGATSGQLNSVGVKTVNLLAGVSLLGGQVYYAAFAYGPVGGTAASIYMTALNGGQSLFGTGAPNIEQTFSNSKYPLSAPFVVAGNISGCPMLALLQ